jgi:hypothetical protein
MTYKVHLDGYNLVPYLTGQTAKSPRESFFYINDDQQLTGLRYDNWKMVLMEQRAVGTMDMTSNTYYEWFIDHVFLRACGPQERRSTNYVKRCRGTAGIKSSGKLAAENS